MKKIIKLQADKDKVYINLNTLRFYSCALYVDSDLEKNWVQIHKQDIKSFIAEQKAQIENSVVTHETTEVKPE